MGKIGNAWAGHGLEGYALLLEGGRPSGGGFSEQKRDHRACHQRGTAGLERWQRLRVEVVG